MNIFIQLFSPWLRYPFWRSHCFNFSFFYACYITAFNALRDSFFASNIGNKIQKVIIFPPKTFIFSSQESQSFNVAGCCLNVSFVCAVQLAAKNQRDLPIPIKHNIYFEDSPLWENFSAAVFNARNSRPSQVVAADRQHCILLFFPSLEQIISPSRSRIILARNLWWSLASHNKLKDKRWRKKSKKIN